MPRYLITPVSGDTITVTMSESRRHIAFRFIPDQDGFGLRAVDGRQGPAAERGGTIAD